MNILWIEDFGAELDAGEKTVISLFQNLIPAQVFDDYWGTDAPNLIDAPETVGQFFSEHSPIHNIKLIHHYGHFLELRDIASQFDVVAIDINLSRGVPKGIPLPDGYDNADQFHARAGFYIYSQLIRSGFPDAQICFLTGEKESTYAEFNDHCRKALIPTPVAFAKNNASLGEFRAWMDRHAQSKYLTLRRGVIEGCQHLLQVAIDTPDRVRFREFLDPESFTQCTVDEYLAATMYDYLCVLPQFLPATPPPQSTQPHFLRFLARALVHEWDDKAKHGRVHGQIRAFAAVMKHARNWMAHSQLLNELVPQDIAYLFLLNMRAMFSLPNGVERYERILLSVFDGVGRLPTGQELETTLAGSYTMIKDTYVRHGGQLNPFLSLRGNNELEPFFDKLANEAQQRKATDVDYVRLLYEILWHQLAQRRTEGIIDPDRYHCDAGPQVFRFAVGDGDFLRTLMETIFTRSFNPQ